MPVTSGTQSVGNTAVAIDGITASPCHIHIRNNDTTKSLYLGNADVTTANGLPLAKLENIDFDVPAGAQIYVISSDTNGHSVSWLRLVQ